MSESSLLCLQVSVYLQNWSHVLSYVNKAESTPEIAEVTTTLTQQSSHFQLILQCLDCVKRLNHRNIHFEGWVLSPLTVRL